MARTSSFLGGQYQRDPTKLPTMFIDYLELNNFYHTVGTGDNVGAVDSSFTAFFTNSVRSYVTDAADATEKTLCNVSDGGFLTNIICPIIDGDASGATVAVKYTIDGAAAVTYTWTATTTNHRSQRLIIGAIDLVRSSGIYDFDEDYPSWDTAAVEASMIYVPSLAIAHAPLACLRFESSLVVTCTVSDVEAAGTVAAGPNGGCNYILDSELKGA